uniref:Uncharacterized protein n=1 Tax=Anopheles albimanus TaxID=7167 RepID=A0A182FXR0_ANOAL
THTHAHIHLRVGIHRRVRISRTDGKNLPFSVVSVAAIARARCILRFTQPSTCTPRRAQGPRKGVFQSLSKSHDRLPRSSGKQAKSKVKVV